MRYQGRITSWKDDQGFGFITPNGGGSEVFVHIKSFSNRQRRPVGNELVTYELFTDGKQRTRASNVAFVGDRLSVAASPRRAISVTFATLFFVIAAGSTYIGKIPFPLLALYVVASLVTFFVYWLDKSFAKSDRRRRIPERKLHFFSIIGGWPGALFAQTLLRHKSKKESFQLVFWATVILNCVALLWLLLPTGSKVLQSILAATS